MTEQNKEEIKKRPIRTYILRQGRITAAQKKAIQDNFQKHAVIFENKIINFDDIFKNKNRGGTINQPLIFYLRGRVSNASNTNLKYIIFTI